MWLLFACASVYRMPGPLGSLGNEPAPVPVVPHTVDARPARKPWFAPEPDGFDVAEAGAQFVGLSCLMVGDKKYRWDCSGYVSAAYALAGYEIQGSAANMLTAARDRGLVHRRKKPSAGDLAFFDNTTDRNDNGLLDDLVTHVALVEAVDGDGTITLIHLGSSGVVRIHMNLYRPDDHVDDDGKMLNDYLRRKGSHDSPRTQYLTGQLWCAFASSWKE